MEITEVQVKIVGDTTDRLKASCSITLDGEFVIRDVKVIEGTNGLFVAMPSRKLTDHCPKCRHKNHLRARYCNNCGQQLNENRAARRGKGTVQLHADVAHPINSTCRERVQARVVEEYEKELEASGKPGYKPRREEEVEEENYENNNEVEASNDVEDGDDEGGHIDDLIAELKQDAQRRRKNFSSGYNPVKEDDREDEDDDADDEDDDADNEDADDDFEENDEVDDVDEEDEEDDQYDDVEEEEEEEEEKPSDEFGAGLF